MADKPRKRLAVQTPKEIAFDKPKKKPTQRGKPDKR